MTKHFIYCAATIGTFFCSAIFPAHAAKLPRYGVFVYSSVCWEKESGDAAGNRVMLIRDGSGDTLYWYWSDGPLEGPNQAHPLTIDDTTSAIQFSVDIGSDIVVDRAGHRSVEAPDVQSFQGSISNEALTLSLKETGPERKWTLPRIRDFSTKPEECK